MKRIAVLLALLLCLPLLSGCTGGQEIESCLFVLSLAVDAAPEGNLTVTVKALSGTQDSSGGSSGPSGSSSGTSGDTSGGEAGGQSSAGGMSQIEETEPGYIVMSATAPSCLRALGLLSATTPRTVNLSQLREVVISQTLAQTNATLSILREIHALFRANGDAVVVVTPGDAGDFIRRQRTILGLRLSKYLEVLFDHYENMDVIPPGSHLSSVIAAMESSTCDAVAVYAAANEFNSTLVLPGTPDTDRLPGHLPRTSPVQNEYMGSALFDGPRMTGVLTGHETGTLCMLMGKGNRQTTIVGGAQYKVPVKPKISRSIDPDGTLRVVINMRLQLEAGEPTMNETEIAASMERAGVDLLRKLQAASCDAIGFGSIAITKSLDIPSWRATMWDQKYEQADVGVSANLHVI